MRRLFPAEIVEEERAHRDSERKILRESSPIEGPFRPAVIAVGDIATYATYGITVVERSITSARSKGKTEEKTQRNAFLE